MQFCGLTIITDKKLAEKIAMDETIQTKLCPKYKQIKQLSGFYKDKYNRDGLQCYCKQCRKQHIKQHRQEHKAEYRQSDKRYYKTHRVERLQSTKRYRQSHKASCLQSEKRYNKTLPGYLRRVWRNMLYRCNNPKNKAYENYGGRGIQVKFASFDDFYDFVVSILKADPRGLTIDRIDNDGHYERGNIRFVTKAENNRNQRKKRAG